MKTRGTMRTRVAMSVRIKLRESTGVTARDVIRVEDEGECKGAAEGEGRMRVGAQLSVRARAGVNVRVSRLRLRERSGCGGLGRSGVVRGSGKDGLSVRVRVRVSRRV